MYCTLASPEYAVAFAALKRQKIQPLTALDGTVLPVAHQVHDFGISHRFTVLHTFEWYLDNYLLHGILLAVCGFIVTVYVYVYAQQCY